MGAQGNQDGVRKGHEAEVGGLDVAAFLPPVLKAHGLDHGGEPGALGDGGFHVVRGNEQGGNACRVIPFHGADEQGLEFVVRFPLYGFHTEPLDVHAGKDAFQLELAYKGGGGGQGFVRFVFPVSFFLKGAEQQPGRIERRALVRNRVRFRSLVFRGLVHADLEADGGAVRRLVAPGEAAGQAEAEKGEGEDFHNRWPPLWHKRPQV